MQINYFLASQLFLKGQDIIVRSKCDPEGLEWSSKDAYTLTDICDLYYPNEAVSFHIVVHDTRPFEPLRRK